MKAPIQRFWHQLFQPLGGKRGAGTGDREAHLPELDPSEQFRLFDAAIENVLETMATKGARVNFAKRMAAFDPRLRPANLQAHDGTFRLWELAEWRIREVPKQVRKDPVVHIRQQLEAKRRELRREFEIADARKNRSLEGVNAADLDLIQREDSLRNCLDEWYGCGCVRLEIGLLARDEALSEATLDGFVESLGLQGIGKGWRIVSEAEARRVLGALARFSMVFGDCEILSEEKAAEVVDRFFDLFESGRDYWSAWGPISTWTFDSGIICTDSSRIGMLWLSEED